jgi:hypothetical protein
VRDSNFSIRPHDPLTNADSEDKAIEQTKLIGAIDPVEGHYAKASVYFDQKQFSDAERNINQRLLPIRSARNPMRNLLLSTLPRREIPKPRRFSDKRLKLIPIIYRAISG